LWREDEPIHIHLYGNVTRKLTVSLNKQKCHFSFTKLEYRRAEHVLLGELVLVGRGRSGVRM
jgi:hypothetical protein